MARMCKNVCGSLIVFWLGARWVVGRSGLRDFVWRYGASRPCRVFFLRRAWVARKCRNVMPRSDWLWLVSCWVLCRSGLRDVRWEYAPSRPCRLILLRRARMARKCKNAMRKLDCVLAGCSLGCGSEWLKKFKLKFMATRRWRLMFLRRTRMAMKCKNAMRKRAFKVQDLLADAWLCLVAFSSEVAGIKLKASMRARACRCGYFPCRSDDRRWPGGDVGAVAYKNTKIVISTCVKIRFTEISLLQPLKNHLFCRSLSWSGRSGRFKVTFFSGHDASWRLRGF